ncbi:porin family protein [Verrucomicrobia bacterium]|nr:porin family protein [Verrucomicrobiota bacterium]
MKTLLKLTCAVAVLAGALNGFAQGDKRIDALENQIRAMQQRLDKVKEGDAANRPPGWLDQTGTSGLKFNFYGEMKYNMTKGSSGNYFDPHRFVLIPGFKLSDNAYFNAELELEHGGVDDANDADGTSGGRFDGELELEQFYADVKINDWLNWRSLGVSLIPVGSINLNHEPNQFYSVHRPIMYKKIIPSTWMESSMGFFGDVPQMESLSWFFLVSQGLSSTDGGLITDSDGIRKTRPNLREKSGNRQLAYTLRLEYDGASSDGWLKGLSGSTSTYIGNYQETTTTDTDMYLWDIEAKYRWSSGFLNNFEVIGDYANIHFTDPDAIADADVGDRMFGYRLELAYHYQMEGDQELVPFIRAEGFDTSEGGKDNNTFNDSGSKDYLSYGLYFQLNRHMELKAAVRQSMDDADSTEFGISVGYQF